MPINRNKPQFTQYLYINLVQKYQQYITININIAMIDA
jgi:hypothetical protein